MSRKVHKVYKVHKVIDPRGALCLGDVSKVISPVVVLLSGAKNPPPIATCRRSFTTFWMTNGAFDTLS